MQGTSTPIRIFFLSTSFPRNASDWRGIFMRNLVEALARSADVELSIWSPPGDLPENVLSLSTEDEAYWLAQLMASGGISHLMRSGRIASFFSPIKLLKMLRAVYKRHRNFDVYHLNWLQCALPLPRNGRPALITVLGNDLKLLRLPFMRPLLRRVMKNRRVTICPNGDWMHKTLKDSFGDVAEIVPVSFGIDPRWFSIERQHSAAVPHCWLAIVRLTQDKIGPLFEWSKEFFCGTDRELHLFGPMQEKIEIPDWVHYHGAATPDELAIRWFTQARGLITLSRHAEGKPQVMLEAMAAGLPIVASRMPAHNTIVEDGLTGILCDSSESFRTAVEALEDSPLNNRFSLAAKERAAREFGNWDDCAERYVRIYKKMLN